MKLIPKLIDLKKKELSYKIYYVRYKVLTAVNMSMLLFWVVTPYGLVGRYQCFGGTYCLHLQGRCR
jgi:hypothetical protein